MRGVAGGGGAPWSDAEPLCDSVLRKTCAFASFPARSTTPAARHTNGVYVTAGFAPPFRVEAHDYPTAIAFVDAGIGVTVLPGLAARHLPPGVVSVPVTGPTPQRTIYAIVQTAGEEMPAVRSVLATLRTCAAS